MVHDPSDTLPAPDIVAVEAKVMGILPPYGPFNV
jgi:hypothetical protein